MLTLIDQNQNDATASEFGATDRAAVEMFWTQNQQGIQNTEETHGVMQVSVTLIEALTECGSTPFPPCRLTPSSSLSVRYRRKELETISTDSDVRGLKGASEQRSSKLLL